MARGGGGRGGLGGPPTPNPKVSLVLGSWRPVATHPPTHLLMYPIISTINARTDPINNQCPDRQTTPQQRKASLIDSLGLDRTPKPLTCPGSLLRAAVAARRRYVDAGGSRRRWRGRGAGAGARAGAGASAGCAACAARGGAVVVDADEVGAALAPARLLRARVAACTRWR